MRNLKKVLSLALAMVMLLGMMVVGAGAATSFKDDDEIQNKEAVSVVSAIGVLQGVGDNTFSPNGTLTRAEAAVVIAKLDLGSEAAKALTPTNAATFKDIAEGSGYGWAKAYIDYCAGSGYIVGDGNGNFLPGKTVTSVEFATMVSRMLGYRDKNEGLDDPDQWVIKATALARKAGLTTNIVMSSTEGMSRDDMAQMAFNALTAPMVEYTGLNISSDTLNINSPATVRTHTGSSLTGNVNNTTYDYSEIDANITPIRLCEEKFPDLKLVRDSLDKFGREFNVWTWKRVNIDGTETQVIPDAEFTARTGAADVKAAINSATGRVDNNNTYGPNIVELFINGKRANNGVTLNGDMIANLTQNGRQVQVYLFDNDHKAIKKVVVVDTYVAKVNSVSKDGTDDRYITVDSQDYSENGPQTPDVTGADTNLNLNRVKTTSDFAAGDVVSYTAAYNETTKKYDIQDVALLEVAATATLEKWVGTGVIDTNKGSSTTNFTAGGETYKYSKNNAIVDDGGNVLTNERSKRIAEFAAGKSEINVYLDQYGYAIYVSGVEAVKNYAAVIGAGQSNQYGSETRGVTLLLPDSTTKEVTARMDIDDWKKLSALDPSGNLVRDLYDSDNRNLVIDPVADVVTYSESNGIYSLTLVDKDSKNPTGNLDATSQTTTVASDNLFFKNGKSAVTIDTVDGQKVCYTTDKTIFMVATQKDKSNAAKGYDYTSYIGYAAAPTIKEENVAGVAYATNKYHPNQIDAIYIIASEVEGIQNYTYFVKGEDPSSTTIAGHVTYTLSAVVDGEVQDIMISAEISENWNEDGKNVQLGSEDVGAGLYVIKNIKFEDDIIVDCDIVKLADAFRFTKGMKTGTIRANDGVLGFGYKDVLSGSGKAEYCAYNNSTNVYKIDTDYGTIEKSTVSAVSTDLNDQAYADSINSGDDRRLTYVFVKEVDGNTKPVVNYYDIDVYVNDEKNTELSKTHVVNGDYDITYAVPANTDATYKIGKDGEVKAVPDDGKITVTVKDANVELYIITDGKTGEMATLTLSTVDALTKDGVEVMYKNAEGKWVVAEGTVSPSPDGRVVTYNIPVGAEVAINGGTDTYADGIFSVGDVLVTGDDTKDQLQFTMPKDDFELNKITDSNLLKAFVAGPGVTLTWTKTSAGDAITPVTETKSDGSTVYYVKATTSGTGADEWTANVDVINVANDGTKTGSKITKGTATAADDSKLAVYEAVELDTTQVKITYKKTAADAGTVVAAATNAKQYWAKGTEITVEAGSNEGDGVLKVADGSAVTGTKYTGGTIEEAMFLRAAWTVHMKDEDITTTEGVADGDLAVAGKNITVKISTALGTVADMKVFNKAGTADYIVGDDSSLKADGATITVAKGLNLVVGTKITTAGSGSGKLYFANTATAGRDEISVASDKTCYVVKGTKVVASNDNNFATTIATADGNLSGEDITSGTNGTSKEVQFVVGGKAITVTFANT